MIQPSSLCRSSFNDELIMAPSKACLAMTDMWAMELGAVGGPLRLVARAIPDPGQAELLVKVTACGVCGPDLHLLDGEVAAQHPLLPAPQRYAEIREGKARFVQCRVRCPT